MSSTKSWGYLGLWALCASLGCACGTAERRAVAQAEPLGSPPPVREPLRPAQGPHENVKELDLNRDSKPDVWTFSASDPGAEGPSHEHTVRKEIDMNGDGRVDITQYFNEREERVREVLDQDFNGKVDAVLFYERGVNVRTERDMTGDGRMDTWLSYEKGKLARKERWENGQVDRIGEDLDGDGTVDRWTKSPRSP
jgi:hypothetical protein